MEKKITISYNWSDDEGKTPKVSHQEPLEGDAMERIFDMTKEGYTSGELHSTVRMDDEDGEDGITYSGYWSLTSQTL